MKAGRSLLSLAMELERQREVKKDLLVPFSLVRYSTEEGGASRVVIDEPAGSTTYGITDLARRQLAEKLKIPYSYFDRMRLEQPALLDRNVNTWLAQDHDRRMLRTLDGNVRAVLSDRYRRLDNWDLAENILPIVDQLAGARLESLELTDARMYLKVVTERITYEVAPGDVVQAGVIVSNSEVGLGPLTVQPLLYRLVCSNGLIASDHSLRKTHVGRLQLPSNEDAEVFKDDTIAADDKAFFLKVRDVVQAAVSEATFMPIAQRLQRTRDIRLMGDVAKSVEILSTRHAFNDEEHAGVLRHLIAGGELSAFGLVNAVTAYSQEAQSYDRATELEAIGGKLVEMTTREWHDIAVPA